MAAVPGHREAIWEWSPYPEGCGRLGVPAFDGQAGLIRGIAAEVLGIIGMDGWDQLVCRAVCLASMSSFGVTRVNGESREPYYQSLRNRDESRGAGLTFRIVLNGAEVPQLGMSAKLDPVPHRE
jgi:hypothetical protein